MTPGYSKLLINELVIPDQGVSLFMSRSDMNMMAVLGSMERSEAQWRELLEPIGLSIINIWAGDDGSESIIEAQLK